MYKSGQRAVLETDDIERVLSDGELLELPEGRQGIIVCLVIDPIAEKRYSKGDTPGSLYVTNGVNHRTLLFEQMTKPDEAAIAEHLEEDAAASVDESSTPVASASEESAPVDATGAAESDADDEEDATSEPEPDEDADEQAEADADSEAQAEPEEEESEDESEDSADASAPQARNELGQFASASADSSAASPEAGALEDELAASDAPAASEPFAQ